MANGIEMIKRCARYGDNFRSGVPHFKPGEHCIGTTNLKIQAGDLRLSALSLYEFVGEGPYEVTEWKSIS